MAFSMGNVAGYLLARAYSVGLTWRTYSSTALPRIRPTWPWCTNCRTELASKLKGLRRCSNWQALLNKSHPRPPLRSTKTKTFRELNMRRADEVVQKIFDNVSTCQRACSKLVHLSFDVECQVRTVKNQWMWINSKVTDNVLRGPVLNTPYFSIRVFRD